MKLTLSFLLLGFVSIAVQAQTPTKADSILTQALTEAQHSDKNVFIKFGASWCGWCKRMDKQMKTGDAAPLFKRNFVIVDYTVDESEENKNLETPGAVDIRAKYHGESSGLPFWVILDAEGNLLDDSFDSNHQNLGCPATVEEVDSFTSKLAHTSDLSKKELDLVTKVFVLKR